MQRLSSGLIELLQDVRESDRARLGFSLFMVVTCAGYLVTELSRLFAGVPTVEWVGVGIAGVFGVTGISMVAKTVALGRSHRKVRLQADREADEELLRLAARSRRKERQRDARLDEPPVE